MSTWRTIVIQVTATATPGNGSANLNWDVTGVTDPAIAGVWIWRIGTLSSEGIWYRELKGSHIFTGLINGTEYDLRVTVVRDGGAELAYGGGKTTPTGTTNPNPEPPVAQTLTATKDTMVRGDDPNRTDFGGKDTMVRGDDPNRTDFGGKDTMRVDDVPRRSATSSSRRRSPPATPSCGCTPPAPIGCRSTCTLSPPAGRRT